MTEPLGTVLVVDDDPAIQDLVGDALDIEGYHVLQAVDGGALSVALTEHPDLILLDIMMPSMDGTEVSQRLRADTATTHIPIVAMSALGKEGAPAGLLVDAWLPKPFDLDQLYHLVASWVR